MNNHALVLLAPGFEEGDVIYCLDRLRAAGVAVSLAAISLGLIKSAHGLSIRPDCTLDQLPADVSYRLVIVPGGRQSTAVLLTDPRIHRLLNAVRDNGGVLAAMASAAPTLAEAGVDRNVGFDKFIVQQDNDIAAFSDQLLNLCLA
jgi:4-methyl-5(b-hydroxyethyl)-thiazole monophosphate biosynthesis